MLLNKNKYRPGNTRRMDSPRGEYFVGPHQFLVWARCKDGCLLYIGSKDGKGWENMTAEERKRHAVVVRADLPIPDFIPKDMAVIRVQPMKLSDKVSPNKNGKTLVYLACMDRV